MPGLVSTTMLAMLSIAILQNFCVIAIRIQSSYEWVEYIRCRQVLIEPLGHIAGECKDLPNAMHPSEKNIADRHTLIMDPLQIRLAGTLQCR